MSSTTIQLETEDRPSTSVGLGPDAADHAPAISKEVKDWADDTQEEYVKDAILRINGIPVDPMVGAAAIYNAYVRKFGSAPVGRDLFGMFPAMEKPFITQEFKYYLRDFSWATDTELDRPLVWSCERIVKYLEEHHPEIEVPRHYSSADRSDLLAKMKATLTPAFAPTKSISLRWGAIRYPTPGHPERTEDITLVAWEADGDLHGAPGRKVAQFFIMSKKQFANEVDAFYDLVMEEVPKVYANKFLVIGKHGNITFLDPYTKVNKDEVIHPADTQEELELRVGRPLDYCEQAYKIDPQMFARKILFTGEVGTAKTMTILVYAQRALNAGCTVIMCQPGNETEFTEAIRFANMHERVIVIVEDLEKMMPDMNNMDLQERLAARSQLLDLFDGSEAKGREIQFWITSNYPKLWDPGMARPGRTDAFFEFRSLDREGFERLMRIKLSGRIGPDVSFDDVWALVGDMSSSFLAKIGDYARDCLLGQPEEYQLTTNDLKIVIRIMRRQNTWYTDLLADLAKEDEVTIDDVMTDLIEGVLEKRNL